MKISNLFSSAVSTISSFKDETMVRGELLAAIAGCKKQVIETTSPAGFPIEEIPFSFMSNMPSAQACILANGKRIIRINKALMACDTLLPFAIAHEEGHLIHTAFDGHNGYDALSAELKADEYASANSTKREILAMIIYLEVSNSQFKKTDLKSYEINIHRINYLKTMIK